MHTCQLVRDYKSISKTTETNSISLINIISMISIFRSISAFLIRKLLMMNEDNENVRMPYVILQDALRYFAGRVRRI